MNFDFKNIRELFKSELPGFQSQIKMAPESRHNTTYDPSLENVKKSAVLILLYPEKGKIFIPFIKRISDGSMHSGQIAFPGGKLEKSDKDLIATALREAEEEIGIKHEDVEVLTKLTSLYIPVSNFLVQPVVAFTEIVPNFIIAEDEVDKMYSVDMNELLNAQTIIKTFKVRNHEITAPFFILRNIEIWGATAMILSELIDIVKNGFHNKNEFLE